MSETLSGFEFQSKIRSIFRFLVEQYEFYELPATEEFVLSFESPDLRIVIKGVHWGGGTMVYIAPIKNPPTSRFVEVPLWAIIKTNLPETYKKFELVTGQISQAEASAKVMMEELDKLLDGDASELIEPRDFLEERVRKY